MMPKDTADVFWLCLTLLVLPIHQQVKLFSFAPMGQGDWHTLSKMDLPNNHILYLISTISEYHGAWSDDFNPECPSLEEMIELLFSDTALRNYSLNAFENAPDWIELKFLAKKVLDESGLGEWENIPDKIDFNDYIEIVKPSQMDQFREVDDINKTSD